MSEQGRRERKKARTRQAISQAALALFLERGYENVTLREIADAADIAASTLFTHFPTKEALVFDLDEGLEDDLVRAVRERSPEVSVLDALREHLESRYLHHHDARDDSLRSLIEKTPALTAYARAMWQRHERALSDAIRQAEGLASDDYSAAALARFALAIPDLAEQQADPVAALRGMFALLASGWDSRPSFGNVTEN